MRYIIMALLIAALSKTALAAETFSYNVSSTSLNSMSCPTGQEITDIFISERSQVQAETRKDKLFFEFTATRYEADGYVTMYYATEPTTIVVFCADTEYNIKLSPKKIDGAAIELPAKDSMVVQSELDGLRREEQISRIIQLTLTDKLTTSKTVAGDQVAKSGDKEFYLRKIHTIAGYYVKEVYVYSELEAQVTEDEILSLKFIDYPVAVTLHDEFFDGWLRVVVIEDAFTGVRNE